MAREKTGSGSSSSSRAWVLLVGTVYLLAVFALADSAIVLALFVRRDADATVSIGLVLILTSVEPLLPAPLGNPPPTKSPF